MIHIDRTSIAPPPELLEAAQQEETEAREFYKDPNYVRYGKPFPFRAYRAKGVRESLLELFHHKCAFCESDFAVSSELDIEHFRPKAMAVNHDGSVSKPGYWWLAWEWSNLFPVCPLCNRTKADRFPVVGPRAKFPDDPNKTIHITETPIQAVATYADGNLAIAASQDGGLYFCDLETAKVKHSKIGGVGTPARLAVTPDGKTAVLASKDGGWVVWKPSRRRSIPDRTILTGEEDVQSLTISPDGRRLVLAVETVMQVWDVQIKEEISRLEVDSGPVNALVISPDGHNIIYATEGTNLIVWDLETSGELRVLSGHEHQVNGVGITRDGKRVISLSESGKLRIWDLESGEQLFEIEGKEDGYDSESLVISADGRFAVCWNRQDVRVLDLHIRQERLSITNHEVEIIDATLTTNGRYVLIAGSDGALVIWNLYPVGAERALILDPCQDDPEYYLVFSEDGLVASVPPDSDSILALDGKRYEGFDRGQITIDTFGLNRAELVDARSLAAQQLRQQVRNVLLGFEVNDPASEKKIQARISYLMGPRFGPVSDEIIQDKMSDLMSAQYAYSAMRRQLLPRIIEEVRDELLADQPVDVSKRWDKPFIPESIEQKIGQYAVEGDTYDKAFKQYETITSERMATPIEETEESDFFLRSAMISRVEIENFRCLDALSFNLSGGSENRVSWKVLLGENGVGKSSVLEAIALAVMGQKRLEALTDIDLTSILKRGADNGFVKVYFSTDTHPVELQLTPEGPVYISTDSSMRIYLLGFGSARWLARKGFEPPEEDPYVRVRNLFNPFIPLADAIKWMMTLKEERQVKKYQKVETVLTRLLQLEPGTRFPLRENVIYVQRPGQTIARSDRLDELSDGYQTVLAIAVAIMDMLGELWGMEMEAAEGLVLLDEIGAHLHPTWKLLIVDSLRSAFPRMQFLAATHEPLCLRGLFDNEILLLRRVDEEIRITDNIESPDTLTVDQLLRSPLFGMLTTFDPDTERDFERYYAILSKPESLRAGDQQELDELRIRLGQKGVLAEMARKQVVYQVIDQHLEDQLSEHDKFDPQVITSETKDLISGLWDEI